MGTVSRVHTFSSGAILTAAQLNNEFDNLLTSSAINGGLDATNLGVTAGQATASKALVVDGSRNLADGTAGNRINNLALSGTFESTGGITATAGITSGGNIVSDTDSTDDLGTTSVRWRNLYVDDVTVTNNVSIGGTLTLTGGLTLNGNVAIGDNASDTLTVNSTITSNLIFTDNTYDIGASGATRPRDLHLSRNALMGGTLGVTGLLTATAGVTSGSNIVSDTDSTDDLGTTSVRWANLYVDSIGDNLQTLSIASLALSFNAASEINTSGNNALTITTGSANLNVTAGTLALTGAQTISGNLTVDTSTLVVDSSNNRVGIGHTAPDVLLHASAGGSDTSSLAGDTQAIFANTAASDSISRVAIIAGATTGFSVLDFGDTGASNSGGITYAHQHDRMSFGASGGTTRASIDSDGLKFGSDTAAANALDDYEEGTWTPAANEGSALTVHSARYTKIGNIVKATAFIEGISPTDNSNRYQINGLPFTTSSAAAYYNVGVIGYSGSAKTEDMGLLAQRNETYLYFHFLNSTNSGGFVQNTDVVSRSISTMIFSITYTAQ